MSHTTAFCFLGILVGVGLCQCQSSSSQLQLEVASADALVTESPSSPSSPDAVVSSVPLHVDAAPAAANLLVASESTLRSVSHAMPFFSSPECSEAFKPGSGGEGFGSLGPMQSSRGKWLVFKPGRDGMWYAHSASGVFPVCSAAPLGTVLGELQRVPVDVQRSRLHIMEASATPLHKPCVYVGRLGLLGGTPTYRPIEWRPGPHIRLSSCDSRTEVYHIPLLPGYRYWGYREDPGSVVQRASCSIRYVAASSKEAINQLSTYDDECALESRLLADVAAGLVNLGAVEGRGGIRQMPKDAGLYASRFSHEALVIYASTGENTLFWQDSRVDVQLEIGMERISPEEEIAQRAVQELLQLQCEDVALRAKLKRNQEKALAARDRARKKPPHPSSVVKGMAFGACEWKKYFKVNVGEEPPLPSNIEEILHAKAPFLLEDEQASQRVRENHILTLIPAQVDGEPFTLDKLGSLIQPHFPDNDRQELGCNSHGFLYYSPYLTSDDRTKPLSRSSYWLLLPKTILEGSRNKRYADRKRMVLRYQSAGYRLPHVLEMATALLSHYVKYEERLYADDNHQKCWTYTACSDLDNNSFPSYVGGFDSSGLVVNHSDFLIPINRGVSCCRKLEVAKVMAFGASDWKKYFKVDVGKEPPLPPDIEAILNSEAPFLLEDEQARQRVRDNHLLTLIPAKVNGEPFTLDKLSSLIQPHFPDNNKQELGDNSRGFHYYSEYLTSAQRIKPLSRSSYWLLLPKTILKDSRNKTYSDREDMVSRYQSVGYRLPHVLEVATALLSHYVKCGERLYVRNSSQMYLTFTACLELDEDGDPFYVGGFESSGLDVSSSSFDVRSSLVSGVSCCRKF